MRLFVDILKVDGKLIYNYLGSNDVKTFYTNDKWC